MLLTVDIGNTNITIGVFDKEKLILESRIATDKSKMGDQYAIDIYNVFRLYDLDPSKFEGAIISSVVPSLDQFLVFAINKICNVDAIVLGPGVKTGMNILIDNPAQLGGDLLAAAVGAVKKYGTPCIVWDLGTATTVSAVSEKGAFLGCAIMAGVRTSLEALVDKTSLLPNIGFEALPKVIGTNTVHSMQSGILYSTAATVDGVTERVKEEMGMDAKVIITGGLSKTILPICKTNLIYDENLILDGLRIIYEKNKKTRK